MIIFLYGSDGYRIKENVDIIVGAYRKKHKSGASHHYFDFTSPTCSGVGELENAIKSVSFFDETKLIIIKGVLCSGQTALGRIKALIDNFGIISDKKTVLVFVENKEQKELLKAGKEIFDFLSSKPNLVRNFEFLNGIKLHNWVKNKFKENEHGVTMSVASLLINIVGNDSWALANEIAKLSNFAAGEAYNNEPRPLTENDVNLLVSRKEVDKIFDLIDAVGNQNKAKAFEMMYRLSNSGCDPHYLLSMLVYHFENLLSVSDFIKKGNSFSSQSIAKQCGLHPFVAGKAISQARKFSEGLLLKRFNYLAGLDIASKNGQVNLEDALYNFAVASRNE